MVMEIRSTMLRESEKGRNMGMKGLAMSHQVELSNEFWNAARRHAGLNGRSITAQIEYWSRIGRIAEDNPDHPYGFIEGAMLSRQEVDDGELTDYQFGSP